MNAPVNADTGKLPSLDAPIERPEKIVLGAPSVEKRTKSNVNNAINLAFIMLAIAVVIVGGYLLATNFIFDTPATTLAAPAAPKVAGSNTSEKNVAVTSKSLEDLKKEIKSKDEQAEIAKAKLSPNPTVLGALPSSAGNSAAQSNPAALPNPSGMPANSAMNSAGATSVNGGGTRPLVNGGAVQQVNTSPMVVTPGARKLDGSASFDFGNTQRPTVAAPKQLDTPLASVKTPPVPAPVPSLWDRDPAFIEPPTPRPVTAPPQSAANNSSASNNTNTNSAFRLRPTSLDSQVARMLPDGDFLLKRGITIPCALRTGIDTTLAGFVVCQVISDVYSANGKTLLVEKGASVFGEQTSSLRQGQARTFVLWGRLDNPSGTYADLDSPIVDRMGASGVAGFVDTHFYERFGGAIMISLIKDFAALIPKPSSANSGPTYNNTTQASQDMAVETIKNTINIPPTLVVNPATVVQIMVARDIDFSQVYKTIK